MKLELYVISFAAIAFANTMVRPAEGRRQIEPAGQALSSAPSASSVTFAADSPELSAQQANLYLQAVTEKQTDQANQILDKMLAINLRRQANYRTNCQTGIELLLSQQLGSSALEKILVAQTRDFLPNDRRIANTLKKLAKAATEQSQENKALDFNKRALEIEQLYSQTETDTKAQHRNNAYRYGMNKEIGYIGQLKQLMTNYRLAHQTGPYSLSTSYYLSDLITLVKEQKDWTLLVELTKAQIAILERTSNYFVPSCTPIRQPVDAKIDLYITLAEALNALDQRSEAAEVANNLPYQNDYTYAEGITNITIAAGDTEQAKYYLGLFEKIDGASYQTFHRPYELYTMWMKLGNKKLANQCLQQMRRPGAQ